jgi:hypothetical protein
MVGAAIGGGMGGLSQGQGIGHAYDQAMQQGLMEGAGGLMLKGAKALAVSAGADRAMAKILGLKFAKNMRLGRNTVDQIENIGKVVNNHVKWAGSLDSLASKIGASKEVLNQETDRIVTEAGKIQKAVGVNLVPYEHTVNEAAKRAKDAAVAFNRGGFVPSIESTANTLLAKLPKMSSPDDVLAVRRLLLKEVDEKTGQRLWPEGTKQFRGWLYHDLNRNIKDALPTTAAKKFAENNFKVNKLILAEDAIEERLAKRATGQEGQRSLGAAFGALAKGSVLPSAGAAYGYSRHHSPVEAAAGALVGYGATRAIESTAAKSSAVLARQAVSKAASLPAVQRLIQISPTVARAIMAIRNTEPQQ